jgi:hypothetical protein
MKICPGGFLTPGRGRSSGGTEEDLFGGMRQENHGSFQARYFFDELKEEAREIERKEEEALRLEPADNYAAIALKLKKAAVERLEDCLRDYFLAAPLLFRFTGNATAPSTLCLLALIFPSRRRLQFFPSLSCF